MGIFIKDEQFLALVEHQAMMHSPEDFYYVATPFTKFEDGHRKAFEYAVKVQGALMRHGLRIYSPIVQFYLASVEFRLPLLGSYWRAVNAPQVAKAASLIVAMLPGWNESKGVADEISDFCAAENKQIFYLPIQMAEFDDIRRNKGVRANISEEMARRERERMHRLSSF